MDSLYRKTLRLASYDSPIGTYILASSSRGVVFIKAEEQVKDRLSRWEAAGVHFESGGKFNKALAHELDEYFAGSLREFSVPLDLRGTVFSLGVWELIRRIPYGQTRSYREIAEALGRPRAARAVGRATGSNPVPIVVPCHRVIGSDGTLTGYGGGLERKKALLALEGVRDLSI